MLVLALAGIPRAAHALPGVVRLKNGGWIEGDIVEVLPGERVTVRASDGAVKQVPWSEVERVEEGPTASPSAEPAPAPPPGDAPSPAVPQLAPSTAKANGPLNMLRATFTMEDTKVYLLGMPRRDAQSVALRFERFVAAPELTDCKELEVVLDDVSSRFPLQHKASLDGATTRETVQAEVTIDFARHVARAEQVAFNLCATKRRLTVAHRPVVQRFVSDFDAQVAQPFAAPAARAPAPAHAVYERPVGYRPAYESREREQAAQPGVREHDGFMLRLTLGLGTGVFTEDLTGSALTGSVSGELSGLSGSFSIDLGGTVAENLVLHARLSDFVLVNPSVEVDGMYLGEASDASLAGLLFAPALTYYLMPANVYFTGAIGLSVMRANGGGGETNSSDAGLGLNVDVGKEWWAGDDWGLGVAARFWYATNQDSESGIDSDKTLIGLAALFSATYQ